MKSFGQLLTAMITPFKDDSSVDYAAAAKLAQYLVENGSDGLVVGGSTGEAATLSNEEKLKLFSTILDAIGDRATVIAGTGSNNTKASEELTKAAEKLGVHGAMLVAPFYNKPPQEGLYRHFADVAAAVNLPIMLYNVPGRTASNILPSTIARLAQIPNIVALKESSGNLEQITEVLRVCPEDFHVYSGDDSLTLPVMAVGGVGIISVAAHVVGKRMKEMIAEFMAGNLSKAQKINLELLPVYKTMFITTNPIPVKTAVNLLGLSGGSFRLPLVPPTAAELEQIKSVLQQAKLI
jgi:4-hydroxy-tetrahydrodipicolinate synthase